MKTVFFYGTEVALLGLAKQVRTKVFHEEQGIDQTLDFDGNDEMAFHVLAFMDGTPIGTVRMIAFGEHGRVGRLCVLKEFRSKGTGSQLMEEIENGARKEGILTLELHSQLHVADFYLKLGYEKDGPIFEEAGISHVNMKKNLAT